MKLYSELSTEKVIEFQQWAREHYSPGSPINGTWHPVVQRECVQINEDAFRELYLGTHLQDNKSDLL